MTLRESTGVEIPVTEYAKSRGFIARKLKWVGRTAAPDKLFSSPRTGPFLVEFKRPGEEPEIHQAREIKRLRDAGFKVYVIDNAEDGRALFD